MKSSFDAHHLGNRARGVPHRNLRGRCEVVLKVSESLASLRDYEVVIHSLRFLIQQASDLRISPFNLFEDARFCLNPLTSAITKW